MSEYLYPASMHSCTDEIHSTVCNDAKTQRNKTSWQAQGAGGHFGTYIPLPKGYLGCPCHRMGFLHRKSNVQCFLIFP